MELMTDLLRKGLKVLLTLEIQAATFYFWQSHWLFRENIQLDGYNILAIQ